MSIQNATDRHKFLEDECLPISALQHLMFCPRQCALIHVERLWADNSLTLEGRHLHEKTDRGRGQRRGEIKITRSMQIRSLEFGLFGKADVVEFRDGAPLPVEYKRGKPKRDGSDRVQLCAQAICLEEMLGRSIAVGELFYGMTRRRDEVVFDIALRRQTTDAARRLHEMVALRETPPARREKKCDRCSLLNLCLPDLSLGSESASRYLDRSLSLVRGNDGPTSCPSVEAAEGVGR